MGDTSLGLLPDFVGCAMVMSLPVGIIGILVGVKIFIRMCGIELTRSFGWRRRSLRRDRYK